MRAGEPGCLDSVPAPPPVSCGVARIVPVKLLAKCARKLLGFCKSQISGAGGDRARAVGWHEGLASPRQCRVRGTDNPAMRRVASGIAGPVARRARDLIRDRRLGGGCPLSGSADESEPPRSPEPAPRHYRHHPRVAVPSELTAEQLRTAPFFEPGRLEPCGEEDAATMSRQIRKRRAYPVGCAARCRHGFARAYLHAPLHAPAATALSFENTQSDGSAPSSSPGNETAPRTTDNTSRRSRSAKAKAALASPSGGARAEHALGWLACPLLDREVDKLERRGGIDAMAAVVANTPALVSFYFIFYFTSYGQLD